MPRKEIKEILDERQNIYGDAHKNFAITGRIWGAMLQTEDIPAWQVALMLDAYKSVRCFANPAHEDSWQDKLGYTIHGREIAMTDEPSR
jgi:hypothetical protein